MKKQRLNELTVQAFREFVSDIKNPDDYKFIINDDSHYYNANDMLKQMEEETEWGINFRESILKGAVKLISLDHNTKSSTVEEEDNQKFKSEKQPETKYIPSPERTMFNAQDILKEMEAETEFGVNFQKSMIGVTILVVMNSIRNNWINDK